MNWFAVDSNENEWEDEDDCISLDSVDEETEEETALDIEMVRLS